MKMRALYLPELHKVELREIEKPVIEQDTDVIAKISLTTICGSDIHLMHGIIPTNPGYVLGHEYVGIVESVGKAVKQFKPGDRVIGPPAPFCGQCEHCLKGNYSYCINGSAAKMHGGGFLPGTHSEYIRVPFADTCLCHVPETLEDEQAIFAFDILSTGFSAVKWANIKPGETVVVFGAGPVGLCAVATAKLYSPNQIILVGREDQFRLDVGRKLGATHTIRSASQDVLATISELTNGRGADVAIDASGSEIAINQAIQCMGIGGRISLIGLGRDITLPLNLMLFKSIQIHTGLGSLSLARELLQMMEANKIDLHPLITHHMKLEEIEKAFRLFEDRKENVLKILIYP